MRDKIEAFFEEQRLANLAALDPEDGPMSTDDAGANQPPEDLNGAGFGD